MALVEAVLVYRPRGIRTEDAVSVGRSADPRVLRALRDSLLKEALEEVRMWHGVDPGVAAMRRAEAQRLAQVLRFLLPDEDLKPDLRLVKDDAEDEDP